MKMLLATACLALGISAAISTDVPEKEPHHPDPGVAARTAVWNELFTDYNVQMFPENVTVKFGIALVDVDLDAEQDIMVANTWVRMVWTDTRLKWDENLTSVKLLRVPASQVWIPDIALYNGVTPQITYTDFNVLVYPNGEVLWVPQTTIKTICSLNVTTHPYDEQICKIKFGSWTYSGFDFDIQPYNDMLLVDLSDFYNDRKYNVTTNIAVRNEKYYPCCKEPYIDMTFTLGLTRNPKREWSTCSTVVE